MHTLTRLLIWMHLRDGKLISRFFLLLFMDKNHFSYTGKTYIITKYAYINGPKVHAFYCVHYTTPLIYISMAIKRC